MKIDITGLFPRSDGMASYTTTLDIPVKWTPTEERFGPLPDDHVPLTIKRVEMHSENGGEMKHFNHQRSAQPEVIELLNCYYSAAMQNPFAHIAICMVGHPNIAAIDFAGEVSLELSQLEAIGLLRERLELSVENWEFPPQDESLDHSFVRYNIANGPLGFDFFCWLIEAEMIRVRNGAPAPLKVGFWLGKDPERTMRDPRRRQFLEHVFRPGLALIGAVEDHRAIYGHHKPLFVPRDIIAAAKLGERVPRLRAPEVIRTGAVTITLREAEHHPHRNSNTLAWMQFADYLRSKNPNDRVIFVRDTAYANMGMAYLSEPLETYPAASTDIRTRMALYEGAKANLVVANGPSILCVHSDVPWLEFCSLDHKDDGVNTPEFWERNMGLKPGTDQYPWSAPNQRIIWKADTFENIVEAWEEHIAPTI